MMKPKKALCKHVIHQYTNTIHNREKPIQKKQSKK